MKNLFKRQRKSANHCLSHVLHMQTHVQIIGKQKSELIPKITLQFMSFCSLFVCRWHIRRNNVDEPIDGYETNQDFKTAHRTHQTITLSSSQQIHQPYQIKHNNSNQQKRIFVLPSGTLSLNDIKRTDAGVYMCVASNTEGTETLEIQLSVIEALTVQILPAHQTVDLGKSTDLVS